MELKIENLSKTYGDVKALNHMSVSFTPGVYGILGPNGAGKSTLIHLITNNVARETGMILWNDKDILKDNQKYREILGYMPQQQGYYADFTAGAFLMYMARLKGMRKKEARCRMEELLQIFHLEQVRDKRIGGFSGGMKQRLLLAQALINDPELLILDEPTAGVDPQERITIRNYISQIATDRIVLLATHIVSDIEAIAKEIMILKSGEMLQKASAAELIASIKPYVWELEIATSELPQMEENYIISNIRTGTQGLSIRVISDNPPPDARPGEGVNLEDVYLYYITQTDSGQHHSDN